ncbi:MAG TPA: AI-2E family transporter [Patescibacteria group bacterium]|nr:AI-2E family transporter [Patescibacteria group bacterium]
MRFEDLEISTRVILKVILAGLILAFLWNIREIILILLLAIILASAMEPLVNYLKTHKIPRPASVTAVYVLVLGILGLLFYSIIPLVLAQTKILLNNLPVYLQVFQDRFGIILGSTNVSDLSQQLFSGIASEQSVVSGTFGIFNGVISGISILVIAFYLVAEQQGMHRFISALVPGQHRDFSVNLLEKIQKKMGLWIIGQIIASVVMFLITWAGLSLLKIQYALILAIIAGVLEVVPYIGPIVSAIPAMFFGLIQGGGGLAFVVALLYFLLHELEGYILIPKIMEKTVGTSPLVVLLAVLIGFQLAGAVGIVIGVPLAGALGVVIDELWPGKTV